MLGPKDFFETLATTDWSGRFESFNTDEQWRLHLYDSLADELGRRSFFQTPQKLSVKASAEESYHRLEHAGEDSLRSMSMTFRQLWQAGEPAQFEGIRSLLRSHAKPPSGGIDAVMLLDFLGERFKNARREEMMRHVWADDPVGDPIKVFRATHVLDDWLYGGAFHTDENKAERVGSWSSVAYEWSLIKAINHVSGVMWELHLIVRGALPMQAAVAA